MKKVLLFATVFAGSILNANAQLYIKGVIDGPLSGGTPKGVQVCASEDIEDISVFGIGSANNGGGTDGEEFTFDAKCVKAGDCFWIASETTQFNNFFGFDPCYTTSAMAINGDDAIELFKDGAVIDLLGDIGVDGSGQPWDYEDGWAYRTSDVASTEFRLADWNFSGKNVLDNQTTNATASTPYPSIDNTCPAELGTCLNLLPVELTAFTAKANNSTVELNWATASELDNDYFAVEVSTDGVRFQTIAEIAGNGTTNEAQNYSFVDNTPANGVNYYRLKQVDFDGAFEYSDIQTVKIEKAGTVSIRPTLAQDEITIALDGTATVTIFNITGKAVMTTTVEDIKTINIANFAKGQYFVRVEANGSIATERFVKL